MRNHRRDFGLALVVTVVLPWRLLISSLHAAPLAEPGNYHLHPALEIRLVAKEPDVVDPVALTFDEQGRMFVLEMRDYPYGFGPERKPGGTIRLLEDTNDDGQFDRSTLFAEGLSFPTSVAPWRGGVLVTAPPEIVFLRDNDGDGKADEREVLFKGFNLDVTDSNVNGLRWGLDNRVHGLNGGNGGSVTSTRKPGPPVGIRNLDFSFDPASGDFTTTCHASGGFGLAFDEWGHSFVTYNIDHMQQRILPVRYLERFPGLAPIDATVSISDHGDMARLYPISEPETRVNHPEQSGHFSSAGGLGFIGWSGYPGDLSGSVLVCDVVGNLVHRDVLKENGPIFAATRAPAEQASEFFASRDKAFRPVGAELGPDGALYLIDMQRDVIEHPDFIPKKVLEKLDIRAGDTRGRIYRVTPKGGLPWRKPNLRQASVTELVQHLADSNAWWRCAAQRVVVDRRDRTAVPELVSMARNKKAPLGRLHALWALEGLGALEETLVAQALADASPGLRENGLLLAERLLAKSELLRGQVLARAGDSHSRVRFQAALTIGQFEHPGAWNALAKVLLADHAHRWSRVAVLSSLREGEDRLLRALLSDVSFRKSVAPSKLELFRELADLAGARANSRGTQGVSLVLPALLQRGLEAPYQLAALQGLETGLARGSAPPALTPEAKSALEQLSRPEAPALFAAAWKVSRALGLPENNAQREALAQATKRVQDNSRPLAARVEDVQLLALGKFSDVGVTLLGLLDGPQPSALQLAALEALREFKEVELARGLVERWRGLAPAARGPVINLLLQRAAFHAVLLTAIETGRLKLGELTLDLEQRRRLLRESAPDIRARAAKLIGDEEYSNRKALVEEWLAKLPAAGEPGRGRAVFEKVCAQCHALGGLGQNVGPDLASLPHRGVEDLLSNILDPNMAIHPAYATYSLETVAGEIETGLLQAESADAVVLLQAQGKKTTVPRAHVKRFESTGLSLMPEGLEAGLTPADMRDLIAFLQQGK
jgi:putative membrane-bound dehydrogenase-like protein